MALVVKRTVVGVAYPEPQTDRKNVLLFALPGGEQITVTLQDASFAFAGVMQLRARIEAPADVVIYRGEIWEGK